MAAKIARATQGLGFMVKWGCDDNKVASHGPERGSLKVARIALSLPDHGKDASFFFSSLWLLLALAEKEVDGIAWGERH